MKRLIVSDDAKADLREIARYSKATWGAEQANRYVNLIIERFAWLMRHSARGAPQDEIIPGLKRVNVRRHAIFYLDRPDAVVVGRVLHQRMDHAGQFRAAPKVGWS
jgi:toxin ParE1/3/4